MLVSNIFKLELPGTITHVNKDLVIQSAWSLSIEPYIIISLYSATIILVISLYYLNEYINNNIITDKFISLGRETSHWDVE